MIVKCPGCMQEHEILDTGVQYICTCGSPLDNAIVIEETPPEIPEAQSTKPQGMDSGIEPEMETFEDLKDFANNLNGYSKASEKEPDLFSLLIAGLTHPGDLTSARQVLEETIRESLGEIDVLENGSHLLLKGALETDAIMAMIELKDKTHELFLGLDNEIKELIDSGTMEQEMNRTKESSPAAGSEAGHPALQKTPSLNNGSVILTTADAIPGREISGNLGIVSAITTIANPDIEYDRAVASLTEQLKQKGSALGAHAMVGTRVDISGDASKQSYTITAVSTAVTLI